MLDDMSSMYSPNSSVSPANNASQTCMAPSAITVRNACFIGASLSALIRIIIVCSRLTQ